MSMGMILRPLLLASAFVAWLTDPAKGQKVIATFGRDIYGSALFTPEGRP